MKKYFYFSILYLIFIGCSPNITLKKLNSNLNDYNNLMSKGKYENMIEYLPTKFWNYYKKKNFITKLTEFEKQFGRLKINNLIIQNASKVIKSKNKYFKFINYSVDLEFKSSNVSKDKLNLFKSSFGIKNVKLDTINELVKIHRNNKMITIFDDNTKKWKFLEFNLNNIEKMYGSEIINEILNLNIFESL